MNRAGWMRQGHRWVSVIFTLTVAANFAARAIVPGEPPAWLTYSPLPPLFLQWLTGAWLFVLPYAARQRAAAPAGG